MVEHVAQQQGERGRPGGDSGHLSLVVPVGVTALCAPGASAELDRFWLWLWFKVGLQLWCMVCAGTALALWLV